MIIYPLCESNVYVIAPGVLINCNSIIVKKFTEQFPGHNLLEVNILIYLLILLFISFACIFKNISSPSADFI